MKELNVFSNVAKSISGELSFFCHPVRTVLVSEGLRELEEVKNKVLRSKLVRPDGQVLELEGSVLFEVVKVPDTTEQVVLDGVTHNAVSTWKETACLYPANGDVDSSVLILTLVNCEVGYKYIKFEYEENGTGNVTYYF
jgi:hypothetical protein